MKFGFIPTEGGHYFQEALREAMAGEALGFDSVWLEEHHSIRNHYWPSPLMALAGGVIKLFGRWTGTVDEQSLNRGFNSLCAEMKNRAGTASASQSGRPQAYLRAIGLGTAVLLVMYFLISAR